MDSSEKDAIPQAVTITEERTELPIIVLLELFSDIDVAWDTLFGPRKTSSRSTLSPPAKPPSTEKPK